MESRNPRTATPFPVTPKSPNNNAGICWMVGGVNAALFAALYNAYIATNAPINNVGDVSMVISTYLFGMAAVACIAKGVKSTAEDIFPNRMNQIYNTSWGTFFCCRKRPDEIIIDNDDHNDNDDNLSSSMPSTRYSHL